MLKHIKAKTPGLTFSDEVMFFGNEGDKDLNTFKLCYDAISVTIMAYCRTMSKERFVNDLYKERSKTVNIL